MRVLFVSASPINDSVSVGNTFLNIMPDDAEFASVYTKGGYPDDRVKSAFKISEKAILKCKKGSVINERYSENSTANSTKTYLLAQKKRYTSLFVLQNLIWRSPVWKSKELENFINEFNPDVIFTLLSNSIYLNRLILYIQKISKKPLAVFAWDNNYFDNPFEGSAFKKALHKKEKKYMKTVVESASKCYVISEAQKTDYEKEFKKKFSVLTKGKDFSSEPQMKTEYNQPLQLLYTGNLGVGRWETLSLISNALKEINRDEIKAQLKIYSPTPITDETENALNIPDSSFLMGSVSSSEIPALQKNADCLVHIESFDKKDEFAVKYSFSTKIVDYLYAARPILAVGPKNIASIDYFLKNDCALVCSNGDEVKLNIEKLINDNQIKNELSRKAYDCGRKNHSADKIKTQTEKDLTNL